MGAWGILGQADGPETKISVSLVMMSFISDEKLINKRTCFQALIKMSSIIKVDVAGGLAWGFHSSLFTWNSTTAPLKRAWLLTIVF